ncbi:MAG TPA: hypothetical protein VM076_24950 [Gemmatimonadaceae bacterium]|nr:hypothetical protein [Gemmatimonadaceae bacterium]
MSARVGGGDYRDVMTGADDVIERSTPGPSRLTMPGALTRCERGCGRAV